MISNVWSVFALTNTIEDPKKLFLMGKCILPSNPIIKEIDYPYVCLNCDENFYNFEITESEE